MAEQLTVNQLVAGSTPAWAATLRTASIKAYSPTEAVLFFQKKFSLDKFGQLFSRPFSALFQSVKWSALPLFAPLFAPLFTPKNRPSEPASPQLQPAAHSAPFRHSRPHKNPPSSRTFSPRRNALSKPPLGNAPRAGTHAALRSRRLRRSTASPAAPIPPKNPSPDGSGTVTTVSTPFE